MQGIRLSPLALLVALAAVSCQAPPAPRPDQAVEIVPIEHATLALKAAGQTIIVDPVGPAGRFAGLGRPDLILVTDVHRDHLDPERLAALRGEATTVIAPPAVVERLGYGRALAAGESLTVGPVAVTALPAYNLAPERLSFHEPGRGVGYVLELAGRRLYLSGDTEDIPEMRALRNIDYAFVCMNLPYTMTVERAADAVLEFRPRVVIPYHYRGRGGFSDREEFRRLVAADPTIQVWLLPWYD